MYLKHIIKTTWEHTGPGGSDQNEHAISRNLDESDTYAPMRAMARARMNAAIRVFDQAIAGANGGDVGAEDLKAITADDFQVILDEALAAEDDAILA